MNLTRKWAAFLMLVMETSFASAKEYKEPGTPKTSSEENSSRPKLSRGVSNYEISGKLSMKRPKKS